MKRVWQYLLAEALFCGIAAWWSFLPVCAATFGPEGGYDLCSPAIPWPANWITFACLEGMWHVALAVFAFLRKLWEAGGA